METLSKFLLPGVLFLLTLAFGFWLSHLGKPYNQILFNVHKLIALAGVVICVIQLIAVFRITLPQWLLILSLTVAAICIVVLFLSGAFLSAGVMEYSLVLTAHRIAIPVLILSLGISSYFLLGMK